MAIRNISRLVEDLKVLNPLNIMHVPRIQFLVQQIFKESQEGMREVTRLERENARLRGLLSRLQKK